MQPALNLLRHDLSQQVGFGEVLRADNDAVVRLAAGEQQQEPQCDRYGRDSSAP